MSRSSSVVSFTVAASVIVACSSSPAPAPPPEPIATSMASTRPIASAPLAASSPIANDPPPAAASTTPVRVPNVANTVASMQRDFQTCFERELDKNHGLAGKLTVRVNIGANGEVTAVQSKLEGLNDAVLKCVETRIRSAQFAPPLGGPEALIVLPLTFIPEPSPPSSAHAPPPPKSKP